MAGKEEGCAGLGGCRAGRVEVGEGGVMVAAVAGVGR